MGFKVKEYRAKQYKYKLIMKIMVYEGLKNVQGRRIIKNKFKSNIEVYY